MINLFTKEFIADFYSPDGEIEWKRLVEYNSAQRSTTVAFLFVIANQLWSFGLVFSKFGSYLLLTRMYTHDVSREFSRISGVRSAS